MNAIIFILILAVIVLFSLIKAFIAKSKVEKKFKDKGIDYLISSLKKNDFNIKEQAIIKLGKIKDPRSVNALISFIKTPEVQEDKESYLLSLALDSLVNIYDDNVKSFFLSSLKDIRLGYRASIAFHIGLLAQRDIKIFEAIEPLLLLLKDLIKAKERKSIEFFNDYLYWTKSALWSLTDQDFGNDVEKWEKWYRENKEIYLVH